MATQPLSRTQTHAHVRTHTHSKTHALTRILTTRTRRSSARAIERVEASARKHASTQASPPSPLLPHTCTHARAPHTPTYTPARTPACMRMCIFACTHLLTHACTQIHTHNRAHTLTQGWVGEEQPSRLYLHSPAQDARTRGGRPLPPTSQRTGPKAPPTHPPTHSSSPSPQCPPATRCTGPIVGEGRCVCV